MTPVEITQLIADTMAAGLPSKLTTAGLENFAVYQNKIPNKADDLEVCVYLDYDDDDTDQAVLGILIQIQLYAKDENQEYHSVINPFLKKNITPELVGFETRQFIKSDHFPMDNNGSAFIFYKIEFSKNLTDCDF
jgi:hypothetical protein